MIKSMTGYGRAHTIIEDREILVEIKAVNHRYFEFFARVPRAYGYLEEKLKSMIHTVVYRGKIEVNVSIFFKDGKDAHIDINMATAKGYVESLRSISDIYSLADDLSLTSISHFTDIFNIYKEIEDEEVVWNMVKPIAEEALNKFVDMRQNEGSKLKADLQHKLKEVQLHTKTVEEQSPLTVELYRKRLYAKLTEVLENTVIDEQRILTEAAIFAEKTAVDEEIIRLYSHLHQFMQLLDTEEAVGRKLDFLVQEINREINTIGSKASDVEVTKLVIEMKSLVEKIREQIQNIE